MTAGRHAAALLGLVLAGTGVNASAQQFPAKAVRIIATDAGGGGDFAARLIATGLASTFGQPVVVENRGGGAGLVAITSVTGAVPDGYTLLVYGTTIWTLPFMQRVPYDPIRDLSPITLAVRSPNILVVHPALPVKSVKDLIELAKARPGQLNYGGSNIGSSPHLAAELFKSMARVDIVGVPYKGGAPAVVDLVAGSLQLMFATLPAARAQINAGRLRAIAVTSAKPSLLFPELPTVGASLPGYEAVTVSGLFAPAKTPATVINRLNRAAVDVLNKPEVKEKFLSAGVETVGNTPAEFAAVIKREMATMGKLIKDAGIRSEQ